MMKELFSHVIILPVLLLSISGFYDAQQATLAARATNQTAGGSISYSVGQTFYEPQQTATGGLTAGVQQPYEIYTLGTQENAVQNSISVYPNPVKDFLVVDLNSEKFRKPEYQLFDGTGRLILKGDLRNLKTEINTSTFSAGLYMLTIISDGKTVKTFKIIKNQ